MKRTILHCDMNNYYATVEAKLNPELRGLPLAVCGSTEERHGIVLAKSYEAKKMGVRTGEAIFEARSKCPGLIIVPPNFEAYIRYSKEAREIYYNYTDRIEPFGIDECWLDLTGTEGLFGPPEEAAARIMEDIREKLGLTISVGISFNKIFAKLASDIAGRDQLFCIGEDFQKTIAPLPVNTLLGIGHATKRKLGRYGIHTLQDLAATDQGFLHRLLGINGIRLHLYANGLDTAPVRPHQESAPVKTVGHGITLVEDVFAPEQIRLVLQELALDVSFRLEGLGLMAKGVEVMIRDSSLAFFQFQAVLPLATASPLLLAEGAYALFQERYHWTFPVRAATIRAISLQPASDSLQTDLLGEYKRKEKQEKIARTIVSLRKRYGRGSLTYAALLGDLKIPKGRNLDVVMPGPMQR